jgi:riboflavin transporter FmnP
MRYYQYLEKRDRKNIIYEDEVEKLKRKGDLSSLLFEGELNDDENAYIISGDEDAKADKNTSMLMKKIVFSVLCIAVSLLLNLAKFTIPNTPALIQTEFSAFPELAAALVVHPLVGCGIVLVKNLIYYFILPNTFPSILSKIILDFVFILSSCYIAKLFMKTKRNRVWLKNREEQSLPYRAYRLEPVIVSEIIASVLTAAASAFTLQYIILPLMYRFFGSYGYNYENVFKSYQLAYDALTKAMPFIKSVIPAMDSMRCGVILYNIPLTFVKYLICSLLAVITYYFINIIINKERR